jgi:hypothetical protein
MTTTFNANIKEKPKDVILEVQSIVKTIDVALVGPQKQKERGKKNGPISSTDNY